MADEHSHGWKDWEGPYSYCPHEIRFCGEFGCACIKVCCYQTLISKKAREAGEVEILIQ